MTHDAALKAIDQAIYRAEENLEDAGRDVAGATGEANRAKATWEKKQQEADRKTEIAGQYRAELEELRLSRAALEAARDAS